MVILMASLKEIPAPPEAPSEAVKPRFGRKQYLVIGLVVIATVVTASIIVFTQFLPSARAVTLGFNYSVGEKMTYELNMTMEIMGTEVPLPGAMWEIEVQGFDGENYTILQTMTVGLQEFSSTMKMNKTGYVVEYIGLPPEFEAMGPTSFSFLGVPGFGSYFPEEEVRVGESWEIPFDMELPGIDSEGTISYELSEIASVTVPAGTYKALKINFEGTDLHVAYSVEEIDFDVTWNINGYIYLEKDTCRLIELRFDQSATVTAMGETESMEMTMQMQLTEHLK